MKTTIGTLVGFVLGLTIAASAQNLTTTRPGLTFRPVHSTGLVFHDLNGEVLRLSATGDVFYKGRLLANDTEILWGLRTALSPGEWCQQWEAQGIGKAP